jgi:hypothetical protein
LVLGLLVARAEQPAFRSCDLEGCLVLGGKRGELGVSGKIAAGSKPGGIAKEILQKALPLRRFRATLRAP